MARYTGPSYKQARRVNFSISETGKELARHPYGPGQHGNDHKGKLSDYGNQLKEKNDVDYTPVKFVKKPSGAKPGMVIYTTNKTVFVNPIEKENSVWK